MLNCGINVKFWLCRCGVPQTGTPLASANPSRGCSLRLGTVNRCVITSTALGVQKHLSVWIVFPKRFQKAVVKCHWSLLSSVRGREASAELLHVVWARFSSCRGRATPGGVLVVCFLKRHFSSYWHIVEWLHSFEAKPSSLSVSAVTSFKRKRAWCWSDSQ